MKRLKKISFYLILYVIIPISFFAILEVALRLSGYGYPTGFFVEQKIGDKEYFVNNFKFGWRFFPKPIARLSASVVVPVKKDQDAFRVFVLGESAAMGDPDPSFSFSRMLQAQLEIQHPDKKIEIYNTAMTAINSHVLVSIAEDCLKLEPDLFIIYAGNNEVIGPYGLSAALSPFLSNHFLIRSKIWFDQTKTGQWLASISSKDEIDQQQWRGMEMFMKNKVGFNDPHLQTIYSNFEKNISAICTKATEAGVKVVLSTVVTNLKDCPPFLSLHKASLNTNELASWQHYFTKGVEEERAGNYQNAIDAYEQALLLDTEYAELNFRLARCYLAIEQNDRACKLFTHAQELDALRFRADGKINEVIKRVANTFSDNGIYLADAKKYTAQQSLSGVVGNDLLYEHVHLNLQGNLLVAECVAREVETALGLVQPKELAELETCKHRLAYTPFDQLRIEQENLARLQAAPFTNQYTNKNDRELLKNRISEINSSWDSLTIRAAQVRYEKAIDQFPADYFLRMNQLRFLFHFKFYQESAKEAEVLFSLLPYEYLSLVNMGGTRQSVGQYSEAEKYYEQAIQLNSYFKEAYKGMGVVKEKQHQYYAVTAYLAKAHSTPQEIAEVYNEAGIYFANQKELDSAIVYFTKAVNQFPEFAEATNNLRHAYDLKQDASMRLKTPRYSELYNQANALFKDGKLEEAIATYKKSIELNSSFAQAYNNIGIASIQLNRPADASYYFAEAIRVNLEFLDSYSNLAVLLGNQERYKESLELLQKSLTYKQDPDVYHLMAEVSQKAGEERSAIFFLQKEKSLRERNN